MLERPSRHASGLEPAVAGGQGRGQPAPGVGDGLAGDELVGVRAGQRRAVGGPECRAIDDEIAGCGAGCHAALAVGRRGRRVDGQLKAGALFEAGLVLLAGVLEVEDGAPPLLVLEQAIKAAGKFAAGDDGFRLMLEAHDRVAAALDYEEKRLGGARQLVAQGAARRGRLRAGQDGGFDRKQLIEHRARARCRGVGVLRRGSEGLLEHFVGEVAFEEEIIRQGGRGAWTDFRRVFERPAQGAAQPSFRLGGREGVPVFQECWVHGPDFGRRRSRRDRAHGRGERPGGGRLAGVDEVLEQDRREAFARGAGLQPDGMEGLLGRRQLDGQQVS